MRNKSFTKVIGLMVFVAVNMVAPLQSVPPPGKGPTFVTVCHKGSTLRINENALNAHLAHGDSLGSCEVTPGSNR